MSTFWTENLSDYAFYALLSFFCMNFSVPPPLMGGDADLDMKLISKTSSRAMPMGVKSPVLSDKILRSPPGKDALIRMNNLERTIKSRLFYQSVNKNFITSNLSFIFKLTITVV